MTRSTIALLAVLCAVARSTSAQGVVSGTLRLQTETPAAGATVAPPFAISGWALDQIATAGSGIDAVHVWAVPNPGSGAAPVFFGAAAIGLARPDVAAAFGPAGATSGYSVTGTLPPGVYDLIVFARSRVTGTFNNSLTVRVTVR